MAFFCATEEVILFHFDARSVASDVPIQPGETYTFAILNNGSKDGESSKLGEMYLIRRRFISSSFN